MYQVEEWAKKAWKRKETRMKRPKKSIWSYLVLKLSQPRNLKGVHLLFNKEKMEGMKKNYKPMAEIEEELRNVDLDNILDFDSF